MVLIMIAILPSAITIRVLKRYRFITYETWKLHRTPGATQQGGGWGWGGERAGQGSAFIGVKGEDPNLKHRVGI